MKEWIKISSLLCVFGFFHDIRPSEPFITEFLTGPWRNFTEDEVNREVYPVGTYSYLAQLVIVFLITDFLRYKPLIIIMGVSGIVVWSMIIWTKTLEAQQAVQFFYGTYMATEVAYYTYIYAKVDKKYYPRVTSHTRAAMFAGKLVGATSAQILTNLNIMNYMELNYITLGTQAIATFWAFTLPKVNRSLYFHREEYLKNCDQSSIDGSNDKDCDGKNIEETNSNQYQPSERVLTSIPWKLLWLHFYTAYTNLRVLQWSILYSVGLCGYLQVISYVQVLWKNIEPEAEIAWNGAVDAVLTALAALSALSAGYIHAGRLKSQTSLLVLSGLTALEGGAILLCCWTSNLFISYVGYILFGALFAFTITVGSAEIARFLEQDSFGLVFGINTLMALLFQTILTVTVVSNSGFSLDVYGQYTVYAFYFIIIGVIYLIFVLFEFSVCKPSDKNTENVLE